MNLLLFPDKQLRAGSWRGELGAFSRALKVGTVLIVHTEMYKTARELENLTYVCWENKEPRVDLPRSPELADKRPPGLMLLEGHATSTL